LAVPELLVMPVRMRPLVKLPLESRMVRMTKWPWPSWKTFWLELV
jgi:hypothetical protein